MLNTDRSKIAIYDMIEIQYYEYWKKYILKSGNIIIITTNILNAINKWINIASTKYNIRIFWND